MTPRESRKESNIKRLENLLLAHIKDEESMLKLHHRAIFGDDELGDTGMKNKVDEIHKMIVQVNGVGSFLKWIIVISASLAALKLWIIK